MLLDLVFRKAGICLFTPIIVSAVAVDEVSFRFVKTDHSFSIVSRSPCELVEHLDSSSEWKGLLEPPVYPDASSSNTESLGQFMGALVAVLSFLNSSSETWREMFEYFI
jgi:hypothetical protein